MPTITKTVSVTDVDLFDKLVNNYLAEGYQISDWDPMSVTRQDYHHPTKIGGSDTVYTQRLRKLV